MRRVVMYSGGIQAWHAAVRVIESHGFATLLFADTRMEDADLYRFLDDTVSRFGPHVELITVTAPHHEQGHDIWDEFKKERFIGNSRIAPCSRNLKQRPARAWLEENCEPDSTRVYIGHDWTEVNRVASAQKGYGPWRVEAPNCEPPYVTKADMIRACREGWGVEPPRLYAAGAPHNNCGGFCVRAGKGHMAWLLRTFPDVFAYHETKEAEAQAAIGTDGTVLKDESLREFRERVEAGAQVDLFDLGGCGCFTEDVS